MPRVLLLACFLGVVGSASAWDLKPDPPLKATDWVPAKELDIRVSVNNIHEFLGVGDQFAPFALRIATKLSSPSSKASSIDVYDLRTGKVAASGVIPMQRVRTASISPDGKLVVCKSQTVPDKISVFDAADGMKETAIATNGVPLSMQFLDANRLAVLELLPDKRASPATYRFAVYAVGQDKAALEVAIPQRPQGGFAVSPGGRYVALLGANSLLILDWNQSKIVETIGLPGKWDEVSFSADGKTLAVMSEINITAETSTLMRWNLLDGTRVETTFRRVQPSTAGTRLQPVRSGGWIVDGRTVLDGAGEPVVEFPKALGTHPVIALAPDTVLGTERNPGLGDQYRRMTGKDTVPERPTVPAPEPVGKWALVPDPPAKLPDWEPAKDLAVHLSERFRDSFRPAPHGSPYLLRFTPGKESPGLDCIAAVYDMRTGINVGMTGPVPSEQACVSPGGRLVAMKSPIGKPGNIDVLDIGKQKAALAIPIEGTILSFGFVEKNRLAVITTAPTRTVSHLELYDAMTGKREANIPVPSPTGTPGFTVSPGGRYAAFPVRTGFTVVDLSAHKLAATLAIPGVQWPGTIRVDAVGIAFSADGKTLAVVCDDNPAPNRAGRTATLVQWNLRDGTLSRSAVATRPWPQRRVGDLETWLRPVRSGGWVLDGRIVLDSTGRSIAEYPNAEIREPVTAIDRGTVLGPAGKTTEMKYGRLAAVETAPKLPPTTSLPPVPKTLVSAVLAPAKPAKPVDVLFNPDKPTRYTEVFAGLGSRYAYAVPAPAETMPGTVVRGRFDVLDFETGAVSPITVPAIQGYPGQTLDGEAVALGNDLEIHQYKPDGSLICRWVPDQSPIMWAAAGRWQALTLGQDGGLVLWALPEAKAAWRVRLFGARLFRFAPDGKHVVLASVNVFQTIRLADGAVVAECPVPRGEPGEPSQAVEARSDFRIASDGATLSVGGTIVRKYVVVDLASGTAGSKTMLPTATKEEANSVAYVRLGPPEPLGGKLYLHGRNILTPGQTEPAWMLRRADPLIWTTHPDGRVWDLSPDTSKSPHGFRIRAAAFPLKELNGYRATLERESTPVLNAGAEIALKIGYCDKYRDIEGVVTQLVQARGWKVVDDGPVELRCSFDAKPGPARRFQCSFPVGGNKELTVEPLVITCRAELIVNGVRQFIRVHKIEQPDEVFRSAGNEAGVAAEMNSRIWGRVYQWIPVGMLPAGSKFVKYEGELVGLPGEAGFDGGRLVVRRPESAPAPENEPVTVERAAASPPAPLPLPPPVEKTPWGVWWAIASVGIILLFAGAYFVARLMRSSPVAIIQRPTPRSEAQPVIRRAMVVKPEMPADDESDLQWQEPTEPVQPADLPRAKRVVRPNPNGE